MELYGERVKEKGKRKADWKFLLDVLLLFRRDIIKPTDGYKSLNTYGMYKSYFKIGWRSLFNRRLETTIKVLGLSLGVCACTVIFLIVNFEFSFDGFHPDANNIYRVISSVQQTTGDTLQFGRTPIPLAERIQSEITSIELCAGIIPYRANIKIKNEANTVQEFDSNLTGTHYTTTVICTENFFRLFPREWLVGNPSAALQNANSVVLTVSKARLYFGDLPFEQFIGKEIVYDDSLILKVAGIVNEWTGNSDLYFTDFISEPTLATHFLQQRIITNSWKEYDMASWTFLKLRESVDLTSVYLQMKSIVSKFGDPGSKLSLRLQPMSEVHFDSSLIENPIRTAHRTTLYTLSGITVFILLLAIANFVVLSIAQSLKRAREVGVRKVFGGSKSNLLAQFLIEVAITTILSTFLALIAVDPILQLFNPFLPSGIKFNPIDESFLIFIFCEIIGVTILSGLYPSVVVSSVLPAISLKGSTNVKTDRRSRLKKGLVVFQFAVSILFIVASIVIKLQLDYTRTKDLGFRSDAIINLDGPKGENISHLKTFVQELTKIQGVQTASLQWLPPMVENPRGMKVKLRLADAKDLQVAQVVGDENYIPLYNIELLAGRNLESSDTAKEVVINKNLSNLMGFQKPEDAIGRNVYWNNKPYPVVGVVGDFHTKSLHEPIVPLCILNRPDREFNIAVKFSTKNQEMDWMAERVANLEKAWKRHFSNSEFRYTFYDDSIALLYEKDRQSATLMNTATVVAILISSMGLFGFALFMVQNRLKEVSIRKVFGASAFGIIKLVGQEFASLIIFALLIASPIAYYVMNYWLQNFAYHIKIEWWFFLCAGFIAIVIAGVTISYLINKVASVNPTENLRGE